MLTDPPRTLRALLEPGGASHDVSRTIRCCLVVAVWLLALCAGRASAQETVSTVLIVRTPKDGGVVARIRAELEANDIWVREVGPDAASAHTPLPLLAANAGAKAALRLQSAKNAVELWVATEAGASGGGEVVKLGSDERDDALLAVRATEAMRARGLRLPKRSDAASGEGRAPSSGGGTAVSGGVPSTTSTEPSTARTDADAERARKQELERQAEAERQAESARLEAQRKAEADRKADEEAQRKAEAERVEAARKAEAERAEAERKAEEEAEAQAELEAEEAEAEQLARSNGPPSLLFIELGPAVALSQSGASPSVAAFANVRLQPAALWSVSLFGFLPFLGGEIQNEMIGEASLRTFMLGGMGDVHATFSGIEISAGAGGALLITKMRAESVAADNPQLQTRSVPDRVTSAILARVGIHFPIASRIRVGVRAMFGLAIPELEVKLGSDYSATWGRPFVLGALTMDFGLPEPVR